MKEHPIIFSVESIRAILAGSKSQARWMVKPQPEASEEIICKRYSPTRIRRDGEEYPGAEVFGFATDYEDWRCPFGGPGDLLWVKEAWCLKAWTDSECRMVGCSDAKIHPNETCHDGMPLRAICRASYSVIIGGAVKWRSPIYMSRWASRLTLENTGVQVQRIQETSEEEAIAEGVESDGGPCSCVDEGSGVAIHKLGTSWRRYDNTIYDWADTPVLSFKSLWNSLYAKPKSTRHNPYTHARELCQVAYPWDDVREETTINRKASKWHDRKVYIVGNPVAWAVSFRRVTK